MSMVNRNITHHSEKLTPIGIQCITGTPCSRCIDPDLTTRIEEITNIGDCTIT